MMPISDHSEEKVDVGAYQEAGKDIPQDKGLLEGFGYDSENSCGYEDDRKVAHKVKLFFHLFEQGPVAGP